MSNSKRRVGFPTWKNPSSPERHGASGFEREKEKGTFYMRDQMPNIIQRIDTMKIQPSQSGTSQRKTSTDRRTFASKYDSEDENEDQGYYDDQDEDSDDQNENQDYEGENTDQDGSDYDQNEDQNQNKPYFLYQQQGPKKANFPAKNDRRSKLVHNQSYSTKYKSGQYEEKKNAEEDKFEDNYQDNDLPHTLASIVGENASQEEQEEYKMYNWELLSKNYQVFLDKIEPNDILQVDLGDCYLLAVLSKLAEQPHRVKKLFITKQENAHGFYEIKLCKKGEWVKIKLDNYFPLKTKIQANGEPIKVSFTDTNGNESWVLIIEKGWVKLHNFYLAISGGDPREIMRAVTGAPADIFFLHSLSNVQKNLLWRKLKEAQTKKYLITCCIHREIDDLTLGIVGKHAYTISRVFEKREIRLLRLRNPWGKRDDTGRGEWEGDYSDQDRIWTEDEDLQKELEQESKDDGIFFIKYSDFDKWFESVQIGYVNDDYELDVVKESSQANETRYFTMKIKAEQEYYIMVNQESKRSNTGIKDFKYSAVSLKVSQMTPSGLKHVCKPVEAADEQVWTKHTFNPGEYCVEVRIDWNGLTKNEFTLNTYGPSMGLIKKSTVQEVTRYLLKSYH